MAASCDASFLGYALELLVMFGMGAGRESRMTWRRQQHEAVVQWPVHLLNEGVSSREDASTSWPSSSDLRRTYHTILKRAAHGLLILKW
jgi:hypothetical protein